MSTNTSLSLPGLIALDLDGTLLRPDHSLSERNKKVLHQMYLKGALPVLSSGRSYEGILPIQKMLGLETPVISYNGAMILDGKGKILRHKTLPENPLRRVIELARSKGVHLQAFCGKEVFAEGQGPETDYYLKATGLKTNTTDFDSWDKLEMTKVILIGPYNRESQSWPELPELNEQIRDELGSQVYTAFSKPFYLEIIDGGSSKGAALTWLADYLKIPQSQTMAFGDGLNDAEMLKAAEVSVAMENSHRDLFDFCTHRTGSSIEDGVARFLEKHFL